jgi:FkbM family methyltransferase
MPTTSPPANVFSRFPPWRGTVPVGFRVNFVGALTPADWFLVAGDTSSGNPDYPPLNEEYFEWIDLLESVLSAESVFTMLEVGAGWGRWGVNAVAALRRANDLPYNLVFVEAEPHHVAMLNQHLANNYVDLSRCRILQAAACGHDGFTTFETCDDPARKWDTKIGGRERVPAVSLPTLLKPLTRVDLIDVDVQGAEYDLLSAAPDELNRAVKRVHVGTHNTQVETRLYLFFSRLGWLNLQNYPHNSSVETPYGRVEFQDGVQSWVNPALCSPDERTALANRAAARVSGSPLNDRIRNSRWMKFLRRLGVLRLHK